MKKMVISMAVVLALISSCIFNTNSHKLNPPEKTVSLIKTVPVAKIEVPERLKPNPPLIKVNLPKEYDAILAGEINSKSTKKFVEFIDASSEQKQVTVRITSQGGDAFAMLLMIQSIEDLKKQKHFKLVCVADIMAASAAFITLETVCDIRLMTYRTMLLAHGVQGGDGDVGNIVTRKDDLHETEILEKAVSVAVAKRMGMTIEAYLAWIFGGNRWMGPEEAVENHAVDGIIDPLDAPSNAFDVLNMSLVY